jgi:hypothetical protein
MANKDDRKGVPPEGTRRPSREIPKISEWPVPKPSNWVEFVNQAMTAKELQKLRLSAQRGQPYGNESWQVTIANLLGLESTLHERGRPRKNSS